MRTESWTPRSPDEAEARELINTWWRIGGTTPREPYTAFVLAEVIAAGKRSGEFRSEIDPMLLGSFLLDAYAGPLLRWVAAPGEPFSLRGALRQVCDIVLNGNSTPGTLPPRSGSTGKRRRSNS